MSSISVPSMTMDRITIGSKTFLYRYRTIKDDKNTRAFITWIEKKSAKHCQQINKECNNQWIFRMYMAARMVLSTSHTFQAWDYALSKNLRVVVPHLLYNSILSASRAVIFACPNCDYSNGDIFSHTHTTTINKTGDILSRYDSDLAKAYKEKVKSLKDDRELFTYKHPTSGDLGIINEAPEELLTVLCEVAQMQSEVFEQSYTKHVHQQFNFDIDEAPEGIFRHQQGNDSIIDHEDWYRLEFLRRKCPRPVSIRLLMTEGWVEDYFNSWAPEPDDDGKVGEDLFNPEEYPGVLFDVHY